MSAEERLVDLAASVADGKSVDWATAETKAADRDLRLIRHLRLVSDVAELYRSLPESVADGARAGGTAPAGRNGAGSSYSIAWAKARRPKCTAPGIRSYSERSR